MIKMRAKFFVAALLAASASAIPAKATTTLAWTLSGVTFDDGGTATGTFTTDSTNGNLVSYDLFTTAGLSLGAFHYDATTSEKNGDNFFTPNSFLISDTNGARYIDLAFVNPLTSGGVDALVIGQNSFELINFGAIRNVTAGFATTSVTASVPEPLSWALMVVGFGLVGVAARRRTTALPA
jgi:hypothetical protein